MAGFSVRVKSSGVSGLAAAGKQRAEATDHQPRSGGQRHGSTADVDRGVDEREISVRTKGERRDEGTGDAIVLGNIDHEGTLGERVEGDRGDVHRTVAGQAVEVTRRQTVDEAGAAARLVVAARERRIELVRAR